MLSISPLSCYTVESGRVNMSPLLAYTVETGGINMLRLTCSSLKEVPESEYLTTSCYTVETGEVDKLSYHHILLYS